MIPILAGLALGGCASMHGSSGPGAAPAEYLPGGAYNSVYQNWRAEQHHQRHSHRK